MFEGYAAKEIQHQQELIFLAWHIEAFARQQQLPRLEKLLRTKKKPAKKQLSKSELKEIAKSKGLTGPW
ncbi:MAG: hypothetical protein U9N81_08450 [Bacillota bacterium]|nr:hypothetical protein [Bacillota bacterium]